MTTKYLIDQLVNYINFGVVPSPNTIFENISKVSPGTFIRVNLDNFSFEKTTYWSPSDYIDSKKFNEDRFFDLFSKSIDHRLVSDVPIANFLSGGLDSTSIIKSNLIIKAKQLILLLLVLMIRNMMNQVGQNLFLKNIKLIILL